jgi:hypothetical protein
MGTPRVSAQHFRRGGRLVWTKKSAHQQRTQWVPHIRTGVHGPKTLGEALPELSAHRVKAFKEFIIGGLAKAGGQR